MQTIRDLTTPPEYTYSPANDVDGELSEPQAAEAADPEAPSADEVAIETQEQLPVKG